MEAFCSKWLSLDDGFFSDCIWLAADLRQREVDDGIVFFSAFRSTPMIIGVSIVVADIETWSRLNDENRRKGNRFNKVLKNLFFLADGTGDKADWE
jgi:hypothetical protein